MNNNFKMTCKTCNIESNFRFFVYMFDGKLCILNDCIKCHKNKKTCRKCCKERPYNDFMVKSTTSKDGLFPWCIKCRKVESAKKYLLKTYGEIS